MFTILIYIYKVTSAIYSYPNNTGCKTRRRKLQPKIAEDFNKNMFGSAHQQNCFQLGTYYHMFGTKQNIVKKPKSIILTISVWQTCRRPQTYKFIS